MQNKKGFTLLELLVVVVIIGILAAIALPQYHMAVGKAKFATLKDNARVIKDAMNRYYLIHDEFTTNLEDLDIELKGRLSQNNQRINLSDDSSCIIGSGIVNCRRNIFGVITEYSQYYNNNLKGCNVYSTDTTDKPNRLCQQETGKSTGSQTGGWTVYQY